MTRAHLRTDTLNDGPEEVKEVGISNKMISGSSLAAGPCQNWLQTVSCLSHLLWLTSCLRLQASLSGTRPPNSSTRPPNSSVTGYAVPYPPTLSDPCERWWWCRASCPLMSVDILGTNCDQCRSTVQYSFTCTETVRLVRTESPGRPPRLSRSSWTLQRKV